MRRSWGLVATAWLFTACGQLTFTGSVQPMQNLSPGASHTSASTNLMPDPSSPNNAVVPLPAIDPNAITSDTNTTVAPPEYGGTSRCQNSNLVLCDGFEAASTHGSPDANTWSIVTSDANNTIEVSDTRSARGAHALHVHSPVVGSIGATIRTSKGFPAPNNTIYGRLFMYLDADQAPGGHSTVVRATGTASNGSNWEQFGGMFHNYVSNWGGPGADNGGYSQTAFPVRKWVCLEWAHQGDAAELDVWADGVSIFVMTNNWVASGGMLQGPQIAYNELDIGWEVYEHFSDDLNTGSYDMYIDEIAVSYQRVGCDR